MRKFCYIILTTLFLASVVALQAVGATRKSAPAASSTPPAQTPRGRGRGEATQPTPREDQQATPPTVPTTPTAKTPPAATPPAAPEEVTLPAINLAANTAGGIIFGKGAIQGKIENSNPTAVKLSWSWDAVNNKYGVFGIKANEKAIISATLKITDAGKEKIVKKTCTVTVTPELDASVTFEAIGTTKNITVGEGPITTKNSDNNIVTIGARKGAVYPITSKNPGTADVTFTSATFSEAKKTVTVTVTKHEEVTLPAINFEANTSKGVNFGEGELLGSPKSSDETVARLSAPYIWNKNKNGYGVFGLKAGSAKLGATIKDKNGKIKNVTIPITVTKGADLSLTFEKIGDTKNILVGQGAVKAKSSPEGVVSIGQLKQDGKFPITAKTLGTATITFEHVQYGTPYPTTIVTVIKPEEMTLPAINFKENTSKGVNFGEGELLGGPKSSDETVARLSAPYIWNKNKNGYGVFGIKAGSAKLDATIKDKNGKIKNVTIPITVTQGADLSLTFEKIDDTKNILVGQGIVTAKSSPEGVLSIGKLKDGTFPITAKALKAATITFEHTLYGKPYPTTIVTVTA